MSDRTAEDGGRVDKFVLKTKFCLHHNTNTNTDRLLQKKSQ